MKIDVSSLKKNIGDSIHYKHKVPVKLFEDKDIKFVEDSFVDLDLTLTNLGAVIMLKGTIEAELFLNCCRCLNYYTDHLSIEIEEDFYNKIELPTDYPEENQLSSDDLRSVYYLGDTIDLFDPIRENILLNVPFKPICNQSCKGFCPECGINLNLKQCQCSGEKIDLRLEVLKKLLPDQDK